MNLPNNMTAYRLTTPEALDFESEYMGHCVGSGGYDENVKNGTTQIYSIRDERGEPHATFEVRNNTIQQCKGKQNKAPVAKYMPAIQEFIKSKKFELGGDTKNTGLIEQDGEYYSILHLPRNFVFRGNLDLSNMGLTELPDMSTVTILGSFTCYHNQLTSLMGAPENVGGNFNCSHTQLTSLMGAPKHVGGDFNCSHNQLTNLTGAPKHVGGKFYCVHNQLTSLMGAPENVGDNFDCDHNQLTSLTGAPKEVGRSFYCDHNQLTSLMGAPENVGRDFDCGHNQLTSLMGVPEKIGGKIISDGNPLTPENSKINAFRQGIKNVPTPTKEHTIIRFDDNHEI